MNPVIELTSFHSPCGELLLGSFGENLCLCDWTSARHHEAALARLRKALRAEISFSASECTQKAVSQLEEYFSGLRTRFDMRLLMVGTPLQKAVWESIRGISYGHTASYKEIAAAIQRPTAVRAVANATGANALSIFVPCHRITGSDGSLTGYAGGLDAKRHLLELEQQAF